MEIVRDGDKRFIVVGDKVRIEVGSAVLDAIEDVKALPTESRVLIVEDAGLVVPSGLREPEKPYDEAKVLFSLALSFVQNAWYTAQQGQVPHNVLTGHESRLTAFNDAAAKDLKKPPKQLKDLTTETYDSKPVKPPREPKAQKIKVPKAPEIESSYELVPGATLPTRGHDGLICKALTSSMNLTTVTAAVQSQGGYETNDPLEKSVRYHLKKLVAAGAVKEVANVTVAPVSPA